MATTPGRLRAASIVLVVAIAVLGVLAAVTAAARADAADAVALEATPELLTAQDLYGALAQADATASTSYLRAGQEAASVRRHYKAELRAAGGYLATVAQSPDLSADARRAVRTISEQLGVYREKMASARFNIRQGNSVGNAYLRQASKLMREEILPAATVLYAHAASRLDDAYASGTSATEVVLLVTAGALALLLLLVVQVYLYRRTHRIVNVGLAAATVLVAVLFAWTLTRVSSEHSALTDARAHGSDAVQTLSAARILNLRAQNDENLALIERGRGEQYVADYKVTAQRIGNSDGTGGLLAFATDTARHSGRAGAVTGLGEQFATVRTAHRAVRARDDDGKYEQAVDLATGAEATAVAKLDEGLQDEIAARQCRIQPAGVGRARRVRRLAGRDPAAHGRSGRARAARTPAPDRGVPMRRQVTPSKRCGAVAVALALGLALAVGCGSPSSKASNASRDALGPVPTTPTTMAPELVEDQACGGEPTKSYRPSELYPPGEMPEGSTMREIQDADQLVVGVDENTDHFAARDPRTGHIEGLEVELVRDIAEAITGSRDKIKFRTVLTADKNNVVAHHEVDLTASADSMTCKRWGQVVVQHGVLHRAAPTLGPKRLRH